MAAEDINYRNGIDLRLVGIAKGVGIEFSDGGAGSRRQSNNFREQMKQKQRERKKER